MLYCWGISTVITTILFYLSFYFLSVLIFRYHPSGKVIRYNFLFISVILIVADLYITYLNPVTFIIQPGETQRGVYFSPYKVEDQVKLRNCICGKRVNFIYKEAYTPNSTRELIRSEYRYSHQYNSLGFRNSLPPTEKDTNEYRIVMLGGSYIEGDGTPDDSTIAELLQNKLNVYGNKIKYTVINGGISGSNPVYDNALFYKFLFQYKPDMVINSCCLNDIKDMDVMNRSCTMPFFEYGYAVSHLFRYFYSEVFKYNNFEEKDIPDSDIKKREMLLRQLRQNNASLKKNLDAHGISLFSVYIPTSYEFYDSYNCKGQYYDELPNALDVDINFISELSNFKDYKKTIHDYYWHYDGHFKPSGYEMAASVIFNKIQDKVKRVNIKSEFP